VTLDNEYRFLKKLYKDIILGYSYIASENIYIKHPCEIDLGLIEDIYIQHFNEAKVRGLPDEKEKIKELCEAEIWSEEKETKIVKNRKQIANLRDTLKKIFIKSQTTSVNNQIKGLEKELKEIFEEREKLIGTTAEKYANKRSNEMIIYSSFFKDENLKDKLFTEKIFEEMDTKDLTKYILIYNTVINNFNEKNVKKIAALPFFLNVSFLSEDNIFIFYGKPIIQLSNFQIELFSNSKTYKNVLSKGVTPSDEYYNNLDDLVDWYELNKSIKDASEVKHRNKNVDGATYIGASKEEIKLINKFNSDDEIIDISKEADKKGGELSMQDIIKLHGL
jgi:hypothetical protein